MSSAPFRLIELTDINDELLLPWLDLYEMSFMPEEKEPVSSHLRLLKKKMRGEKTGTAMLAAVDDARQVVGLIKYQVPGIAQVAILWYFAVQPDLRSKGLGSILYREFCNRLIAEGTKTLVYEVEIPEEAKDDEQKVFAQRRIAFYRRLGARLLTGIHYLQTVDFQPPIPMHVMIHGFEPLEGQAAYGIAKAIFGDAIQQIAPPTLE